MIAADLSTTALEPITVALKFGFIAVLYLFLIWVVRSAAKDLRGRSIGDVQAAADATSMYAASVAPGPELAAEDPVLRVKRAAGLRADSIYEIDHALTFGRASDAEVKLEDPFASQHHARIAREGEQFILEDLGSTNGTHLNEDPVEGPRPLHTGDRIRIGDSVFIFEA